MAKGKQNSAITKRSEKISVPTARMIFKKSHLNQSDERSEYGTSSYPGEASVMRYRSLSFKLNVPERNQCQTMLRSEYQGEVPQGTMMESQMVSMSWTTFTTQNACAEIG